MHYFEEEYQRRFKDAESTTGVDPDQLWQDIAGELPAENNGKWRRSFWLILFLISSGVGVGAYFFWGEGKTPATATSPHVYEKPVASAIPEEHPIITAAVTDQGSHLGVAENASVPKESTEENATLNPQLAATEGGKSMSLQLTAGRITTVVSNGSPETAPQENLLADEAPGRNTNFVQPMPDQPIDQGSNRQDWISPKLASELAPLEHLSAVALPTIQPVRANPKKSKQINTWNVAVNTSALSWNDRFEGQADAMQFGAELHQAHRAQGGFGLGISLQKPIGDGWSFSVGLDYQQIYNTFEWSRNWDTVMYRNEQPGADLINAVGLRKVRHQNKIQLLHLPMMLGYELGKGSLRFGWQAGLGLNLITKQSGRTLVENELVQDYNESTVGPYRRFFPSADFSPYLGYQMGERTQIRLHGQARYQWHGRSDLYQLQHQSILLGGGVSVHYRW